MASDIRDKARKWIEDNLPPLGQEVRSDKPPPPPGKSFQDLTGLTQEYLEKQWKKQEGKPPKKRDCETSCNGFVIHYCIGIGLPSKLGRFDCPETIVRSDMKLAWVPSTPESKPKSGDICFWDPAHKKGLQGLHVGVCHSWDLEITDTLRNWTWHTAEGGQKGPTYDDTGHDGNPPDHKYLRGYDVVKRKRYPDPNNAPANPTYDSKMLKGWVDIERYFALSQPQTDEGTTAKLRPWLNEDGRVVHPDAPPGGGGQGYFRFAGIMCADSCADRLPNPWAPVTEVLDPLKVSKQKELIDNMLFGKKYT